MRVRILRIIDVYNNTVLCIQGPDSGWTWVCVNSTREPSLMDSDDLWFKTTMGELRSVDVIFDSEEGGKQ